MRLGHRRDFHHFALHRRTGQTRKGKQIFDQRGHLLDVDAHALEVALGGRIERMAVILGQRLGEAVDCAQGARRSCDTE